MSNERTLIVIGPPDTEIRVIERRRDDIDPAIFYDGKIGSDGRARISLPIAHAVLLAPPRDTRPIVFEDHEREKTIVL
jgi:hypothetical protein